MYARSARAMARRHRHRAAPRSISEERVKPWRLARQHAKACAWRACLFAEPAAIRRHAAHNARKAALKRHGGQHCVVRGAAPALAPPAVGYAARLRWHASLTAVDTSVPAVGVACCASIRSCPSAIWAWGVSAIFCLGVNIVRHIERVRADALWRVDGITT